MLRLEGSKHHYWRNIYALAPVLAAEVFLGDAFDWRVADLAPALVSVFRELLPGVVEGALSGGAPELIANFTQALQLLGDTTASSCGVRSRDPVRRTAALFFSCRDPYLANGVLSMAVRVVDRLVQSQADAELLAKMLRASIAVAEDMCLSDATRCMVYAVEQRAIPWFRVAPQQNFVQLGQGARQQRMRTSVMSYESGLAQDLARSKFLTLSILSQIRLPAGKFAVLKDAASAFQIAEAIGYPVVLKPVIGGRGRAVYSHLRDAAELRSVLERVPIDREQFLLQSFFPGDDHRLLVLNGKLAAAAKRIPASVTGDGRNSIADLVEIENRRRVHSLLYPLKLDAETDRVLAQQGYTSQTVPADGVRIRIRATANMATGGIFVDVTPNVHPDNARLAVRAAKAIGLTVAGIDFISPDISRSWHEVGGGICEVNTGVGVAVKDLFDPAPEEARIVLESAYPRGDDGRIPTAMVTGTYGKTTTCMMLGGILSLMGHTVGTASTEGVTIGDEGIAAGDHAGAAGGSIVLRDPTVTAAVLETARGGLLKTGMYLDRCDVAALLNVEREQVGMDGVETLDDMAALKRKVLDAATKAVVLNADDPRCLALVPEFTAHVRTILFSRRAHAPALRDHIGRGGDTLYLSGNDGNQTIVVAKGEVAGPLLRTADIPVTEGGLFWQHSCNAMAAAGLAIGLGVDLDTIRKGLMRYGSGVRPARHRISLVREFPIPILFDFAASAPAIASVTAIANAIPVAGKRLCAVTLVGNRPDWQFAECAAAIAGHFDIFICFELEMYRRGRAKGQLMALLSQALIAAGVDPASIFMAADEPEAVRIIARKARDGDFAVIFGADPTTLVDHYREAFRDWQKIPADA